jgi:hypothetical protein
MPAMPDDDRWRNDPERYRYRDDDRWGEGAWGYPRGRRGEYRGGGFGAAGRESWYAAGNGDYRPETDRNYGGGSGAERYAEAHRGRGYREDYRGDFLGSERDYGTSAGYGTGGSALDWREVEGGGRRDWERRRREPGFTDLAFGHGFGTGYEGRDWSGPRRERRGNWDYGRERHERGFLESVRRAVADRSGSSVSMASPVRDSAGGPDRSQAFLTGAPAGSLSASAPAGSGRGLGRRAPAGGHRDRSAALAVAASKLLTHRRGIGLVGPPGR